MSGNVIKSDSADELLSKLENFNFTVVEAEARQIVERAFREAEEQVQRAKAEIDKMRAEIREQEFEAVRKEGYEKGYQEGLTKGQEDGFQQAYETNLNELRENVAELPDVLSTLANELEKRRGELVEDAEDDLLALAFGIADKVIQFKTQIDPKVVQGTLRRAIDLVLKRASLEVTVSTDDVIAIEEYMPELSKIFGDLGAVNLHADMNISKGSVIVRTGRGEVNMKLRDLLDEIAASLLGEDVEDIRARLDKYDPDYKGKEENLYSNVDDNVMARLDALEELRESGDVSIGTAGDLESASDDDEGFIDAGATMHLPSGEESDDRAHSTDKVMSDLLDEFRESRESEGDDESAESGGGLDSALGDVLAEASDGAGTPHTQEDDLDYHTVDRDTDVLPQGVSGKLTTALNEHNTADLEKMADAALTELNPDGSVTVTDSVIEDPASDDSTSLTDVSIDDLLKEEG